MKRYSDAAAARTSPPAPTGTQRRSVRRLRTSEAARDAAAPSAVLAAARACAGAGTVSQKAIRSFSSSPMLSYRSSGDFARLVSTTRLTTGAICGSIWSRGVGSAWRILWKTACRLSPGKARWYVSNS